MAQTFGVYVRFRAHHCGTNDWKERLRMTLERFLLVDADDLTGATSDSDGGIFKCGLQFTHLRLPSNLAFR